MFATVATIVLPVFGLVGIGLALGQLKFFPEGTGRGMENYLYRFALPILVFNAIAKAELPASPSWALWVSYFVGMYTGWALVQFVLIRFGHERPVAVLGGFTAAFSNQVLIGIPLISSAFGDEGLVPFFLLLSLHFPLAASVATVMIESEGRSDGVGKTLLATGRSIVRHPILIGMAIGLVFNLLGIRLPGIPDQIVSWIAESAVPCALIAMGLAVRRTGLGELSGALVLVAVVKLVLHPVIVFVLAAWVFELPMLWVNVLVLAAALPPGLNAYLLALPFPKAIPLTSAGVTVATGIGVVTVSLWLTFLLSRGG